MLPKKLLVRNGGQSLIEVLVALSLAVLAIGALVSVTVTSVKNAQFSQNQTQAEKYAQEGMEWVRLQKESLPSWSAFSGKSSPSPYCINNLDWNLPFSCGASNITGTIYKRELNLSQPGDCPNSSPSPINAKVTVYWTDSIRIHQAVRETCFTNWEKK